MPPEVRAGAGPGTGVSGHALDLPAIERTLSLLARAVRQFHTYPPTSPLCVDAVMACHEALQTISRDRVSVRLTQTAAIVDDLGLGAGTVTEHELTRRLYRHKVASLEIDTAASPRDLTRFSIDLVDETQSDETSFAERLTEHGVDTIVPAMAERPAVLDLGVAPPEARELVEHERRRQEHLALTDAPATYLYPPDKGWVRFDPSQALDSVSLLDLVVLVDDPAEVASMLVQLTGDDGTTGEPQRTALERKYSDVTTLFSALDPRLAQVMFGKLARAVLGLEPDRRNDLLQRAILPGLLDGKPDGRVLSEFPDIDLAESVCLLLDLETAAPEVLSAALGRLDLSTDRRAALAPLIEQRMQGGRIEKRDTADPGDVSGVERHARNLLQVSTGGADYSEFAAFDLSMDEQAQTTVTGVRDGIADTDLPIAQLKCLSQLARIERNPTIVEAVVRRSLGLLSALERDGRWQPLADAVRAFASLSGELRERRPDVADAISTVLSEFWTPGRLVAITEVQARDDEGRAAVLSLARELGPALVPGFVALMTQAGGQPGARAVAELMTSVAAEVAPALAAEAGSCSPAAARAIARVLGHAGPGHEVVLGRLVQHQDVQVAREALRGLARMGTPGAAVLVTRQLREATDDRGVAAEEALWQFAPAQRSGLLRDLLRSREFVFGHPQAAARVIERAQQTKIRGLEDALAGLEALRFRFWNPALAQVGRKAREVRQR
jgi:hypothetical protein